MTEKSLAAGLAEFEFEKGAARLSGFARSEKLASLRGQARAKHILFADELLDQRLEAIVLVGRNRGGTANNKGRAGLVDEDGVHFIDNGEIMPALHLLLTAAGHAIVAKVVETKLAIRAIGDIAFVLRPAMAWILVVLDNTDSESEKLVKMAHPLRVAAGEVVIHSDHVNATSREGVEIDGKGCHQRLAFTGCHFRDAAIVEHHATNQLHIEVNHVPNKGMFADDQFPSRKTTGAIFYNSESLGQNGGEFLGQFIQIVNFGKPLFPLESLGAKRLIGQRLQAHFEFVGPLNDREHATQFALVF